MQSHHEHDKQISGILLEQEQKSSRNREREGDKERKTIWLIMEEGRKGIVCGREKQEAEEILRGVVEVIQYFPVYVVRATMVL